MFDPASLLTLVRPATRMITVNFPHNPTGFLPSHEEWARVVAAASGVGAYLFADEMYRGLEAEAADRLVPAADAYERGISLGGLSKSVGLPGLRIGWLACRDPEGEALSWWCGRGLGPGTVWTCRPAVARAGKQSLPLSRPGLKQAPCTHTLASSTPAPPVQ